MPVCNINKKIVPDVRGIIEIIERFQNILGNSCNTLYELFFVVTLEGSYFSHFRRSFKGAAFLNGKNNEVITCSNKSLHKLPTAVEQHFVSFQRSFKMKVFLYKTKELSQ